MNTRFTAFVPKYIDLTRFNKIPYNWRYDFVGVDSASFNSNVELSRLSRYIFIERDHIACYNKTATVNPMKLKFTPGTSTAYQAFDKLNEAYSLLYNSGFFETPVKNSEDNTPPLICFIEEGDSEPSCQFSTMLHDLSLRLYSRDSQGRIDIDSLSKVARDIHNYEHNVFVVKDGDDFKVYTLDTTISHTLIAAIKVTAMLRAGSCSIHDLAIVDGYLPLKQQLRDFKLCDRTGTPVEEGEEFWLQIADWCTSDFEKGYDTEATSFHYKYGNTDCIHAYDVVYGSLGDPTMLTHEVIDGITYLKAGGKYFYIEGSEEIGLSDSIPQKEERVQIEYDHRGDIMLYSWGGAMFSSCEYIKSSYGAIRLDEVGTSPEEIWPMVLRLHRR